MNKEILPKLPYNLKPELVFWVDEGTTVVIQAQDEKCVYSFHWDGYTPSYQSFLVRLKVELE